MTKIKTEMRKLWSYVTQSNAKRALLVVFPSLILISNVIAFKTWNFFGIATFTGEILLCPLTYIIDDITTEVYGHKFARKLVMVGFAVNIFAVAMYQLAIILPSGSYFADQNAFATVLNNTPRMLLASFVSYLCSSFTTIGIMHFGKKWFEKQLAARVILSTLFGCFVENALFMVIGFVGQMPVPAIVSVVVAQTLFKLVFEIVCYWPITKPIILKLKRDK